LQCPSKGRRPECSQCTSCVRHWGWITAKCIYCGQDPSFFVYPHRVDIDITYMLTHLSPPSLHTTHADDQKLGQLKLHECESSVYLLRSGKGQSQSWHPLPVPKIYKKPLLIISQHCWKYSTVSGDKGCPNVTFSMESGFVYLEKLYT